MKLSDLPLTALGVGIVLVVLSLIWPSIIGKAVWSEQQAREHATAAAELHRLAHGHAHAADHAAGVEGEHNRGSLEEAKQRYERSQDMLQRAKTYRQGTARLLRWAGTACSLLGAAGYFLLRSAAG
jgi:ABC-type transport system involved in cytochrome bd biosynthesis fused ATPase/permease subunit